LQILHENYFAPFLNVSVFRLINWFYNGSNNKSLDDVVHNVMLADGFRKDGLVGFVRHVKWGAWTGSTAHSLVFLL
jgi:hypothetical protein